MTAHDDPYADLSAAYSNMDFIPGRAEYPMRWAALALNFRSRLGAQAKLGLAYGPGARQRFDLFLPKRTPRGLFVFIHGGYWLSFDPSFWSHLAEGALAHDWACALPGYTLAPEARVSAMTAEALSAIAAAARLVPDGPLVIAGHSAGGHLAARMACDDLSPPFAARLRRVVPISPLADLRPLLRTKMNETLQLDPAEAAQESPALHAKRPEVGAYVWVGGQERPAFLWQARLLSEVWACPWHVAEGRHHFDVIEDLCNPASRLMAVALG